MKAAMTEKEREDRRTARKVERELAKKQARIETEKNQKPVKSITITIEWKKSKMWGSNPHASAQVEYMDGSYDHRDGYTASGCGYDKESTVIADVFDEFLKYKLWGTLPTDKQFWLNGEKVNKPYGISIGEDYRHYSGGIGTNCYYTISEFIGGKFEQVASGKSFDVYKYTDKEAHND